MGARSNHQEIVKQLLDTKAVDFDAVGKAVAKLGPGLAMTDDPWDVFCWTMRTFIRFYIINPRGPLLEDLGGLRDVAGKIGG